METSSEQLNFKVEHELPKQTAKVAHKMVNKTEKKLFSLLKD